MLIKENAISTSLKGSLWTGNSRNVQSPITLDNIVRQMFMNNEQGFAYDPNDLTTMFQDSAGTTPVTAAGQTIGLVLDKSKGLVLSNQYIVSPNDLSHSAYTKDAVNVTLNMGVSTIVPTTSNAIHRVSQEIGSVIGKVTRFEFTIKSNGIRYVYCNLQAGWGKRICIDLQTGIFTGDTANSTLVALDNGWYKVTVKLVGAVATIASSRIWFQANTTYVASDQTWVANGVDGFSIGYVNAWYIEGNHAYQTTSASRPILRQNATTKAYYLEFDGVDDKLTTILPTQLTGCTVIRAVPNVGCQILTNQTIPTTYNDSTSHCGLIVINRALTTYETSAITKIFNKLSGV